MERGPVPHEKLKLKMFCRFDEKVLVVLIVLEGVPLEKGLPFSDRINKILRGRDP